MLRGHAGRFNGTLDGVILGESERVEDRKKKNKNTKQNEF